MVSLTNASSTAAGGEVMANLQLAVNGEYFDLMKAGLVASVLGAGRIAVRS